MILLSFFRRWVGRVGLVAGFLALCACGAAVGDSTNQKPDSSVAEAGPTVSAFAIPAATLPAGDVGQTYATTALHAVGATGAVTWTRASGALPPGLVLSSDGVVSGLPSATGTYSFVARARASGAEATRSFQIAVGTLALVVEDLPYAKAWCERPVTVVAQGASGDVTFRTRANGSGGRFLTTSATTGRATWAPGQSGGSGVVDRLEVEDARGRKAELTLTVMPNPVAHHVADFSSSDVWYVDVGRKFGSHGFATDFHDALAFLGLRSPTSRDATGTLADRLAALVVQRRILRELNMRFGRDADGRIGAGLPISFPIELPTGYERPAAGSWLTGGAGRYSVMGIHHANSTGVVGMAYQDGVGNDLHEHNTSGPSGELGVFVNHYVETVRMIYGDDLAEDPIGDADVAVLEALLYDLPTYGGRRDLIERTVRTFAKTTAELCAHEMGHSLGLQHTNPRTSRSLMNTAVFVSDEVNHFLPDDYEQLGRALPGAGRAGGVSKPGSFPNGVEACTLRLDPAQSRPLPLWAVPATR